jgi:hypothetical protein
MHNYHFKSPMQKVGSLPKVKKTRSEKMESPLSRYMHVSPTGQSISKQTSITQSSK